MAEARPSTTAPAGQVFATTHWSVVLAAGESGSAEGERALASLCRAYWFPLYGYVRRLGYGPEDARDLTQEFFARLLDRRLYRLADRERGRFRTFLLTALRNFIFNERDKQRAQRRGGHCQFVSWEELDPEARFQAEPADGLTPERAFDRQWALALLDRVLERLREEAARAGRAEQFERLKHLVWGGTATVSYSDLAAELGGSESGLRVAVHRLRHRFRELLRAEIAHTVARPEEVDEELRALIETLAT